MESWSMNPTETLASICQSREPDVMPLLEPPSMPLLEPPSMPLLEPPSMPLLEPPSMPLIQFEKWKSFRKMKEFLWKYNWIRKTRCERFPFPITGSGNG